ncbi:MAG: 4-hydroxy-tetrahydrodipicolinate synthase [Clostridiales bacterium]
MKLEGVYLPIITPFNNGKLDFKSYKKLIDYYINKGISGIIPNGTTGECPTLCEYEVFELIEKTVEFVNGRVPVFVGMGSNFTNRLIKTIENLSKYNILGILSVCPYYNRPSQKGLYDHFVKISESTELKIIIYNIPYRTGVNLENNTIRRLAELNNIIGVKDSCGNINQSLELILNKPEKFSVLTGEDYLFYPLCASGGDGGILAAAHMNTEDYLCVFKNIKANNYFEALRIWKNISKIIPKLFEEPNPAPVKYLLKENDMIISDEVRLPITEISCNLKSELKMQHLYSC